MDNFEIFDKYLFNKMDSDEKSQFEKQLESDKVLSQEFRLYLQIVDGIRKEEEQDCADFAYAMRKINKEELQQIIGKRKKEKKAHIKISKNRFLVYNIMSAAAIFVIAFIPYLVRMANNYQYQIYNVVAEYNYSPISRDSGTYISYNVIEEKDIELFEQMYESAITKQEVQENGKNLAMVYLKFHQQKDAVKLLCKLIEQYKDDPESEQFIEECRDIIDKID